MLRNSRLKYPHIFIWSSELISLEPSIWRLTTAKEESEQQDFAKVTEAVRLPGRRPVFSWVFLYLLPFPSAAFFLCTLEHSEEPFGYSKQGHSTSISAFQLPKLIKDSNRGTGFALGLRRWIQTWTQVQVHTRPLQLQC